MSLEDLMQNIITYHPPDYMRRRLESNDVHLFQRATQAEMDAQLDVKLHQLSVDYSPYWLVSQLCAKQDLIAMMEQQFHEIFPGVDFRTLDMPALTKCVLKAFCIPIPIRPKGIKRIRDELDACKQQIDLYMSQSVRTQRAGGRELHMRRALSISCWTYLEALLKQVLGFYAVHFGKIAEAITQELRAAFVEIGCVRSKPLGSILKAFEEIEFIFKYGESRGQQKAREKRIKEEIQKAAYGTQSVVERTRLEAETARRQGEEVARRLREECMDAFGCHSPFSFLQIDEIQKLVKRYRNPYAHETIDSLMRDDPTGKTAKQSITAALNFVDDLISNGIVPRLVFLVAEGKDAYGRRFISYIGEEHLGDEDISTYSLNKSMHFYHSTLQFDPLIAYLLVDRQDIGSCYEPSVYSYKDVISFINV